MSLDATRWAWSVRGLTPNDRFVLLRLADCHEGGLVWRSHDYLAEDTGLSVDTVRRSIRALVDAKLLQVAEASGACRSARYKLDFGRLEPAEAYRPDGKRAPTPQRSGSHGATQVGCKEPPTDEPSGLHGATHVGGTVLPTEAQSGSHGATQPESPLGSTVLPTGLHGATHMGSTVLPDPTNNNQQQPEPDHALCAEAPSAQAGPTAEQPAAKPQRRRKSGDDPDPAFVEAKRIVPVLAANLESRGLTVTADYGTVCAVAKLVRKHGAAKVEAVFAKALHAPLDGWPLKGGLGGCVCGNGFDALANLGLSNGKAAGTRPRNEEDDAWSRFSHLQAKPIESPELFAP